MTTLEDVRLAVERGDAAVAEAAAGALIGAGAAPSAVLDGALLPAMAAVGVRFRDRELFLPDVLLAARAMKAAMGRLEPLLLRERAPVKGIIVLGTVRGDLHDIGKNLVSVMLQGAGWRVVDLGIDVEADAFIDAALDAGAPLVGMSALLTTTMTAMGEVIERIAARGLAGELRTLVGGAPVTAAFAAEIGADGWAADAVSAVARAEELAGR